MATAPPSVLAARFRVDEVVAPDPGPRWNVAPTDEVLAIAAAGAGRRLGAFSWGLVPGWAARAAGDRPPRRLINLRSETLLSRGGFRRRLERNRCLIPADGFYEWRPAAPGRAKVPHFIRGRGGAPLALAGLWAAVRQGPPGDESAPWLRTCAILTGPPNDLVAGVHDRMPVILPESAWETWLDPAVDDAPHLLDLCQPIPAPALEMWPVGPAVNRVANDGPALIEPAPAHPAGPERG